MATRIERLEGFATIVLPASDEPMELVCEDHAGTYLLPYACRWDGALWRNAITADPIEGRVVGWRLYRDVLN